MKVINKILIVFLSTIALANCSESDQDPLNGKWVNMRSDGELVFKINGKFESYLAGNLDDEGEYQLLNGNEIVFKSDKFLGELKNAEENLEATLKFKFNEDFIELNVVGISDLNKGQILFKNYFAKLPEKTDEEHLKNRQSLIKSLAGEWKVKDAFQRITFENSGSAQICDASRKCDDVQVDLLASSFIVMRAKNSEENVLKGSIDMKNNVVVIKPFKNYLIEGNRNYARTFPYDFSIEVPEDEYIQLTKIEETTPAERPADTLPSEDGQLRSSGSSNNESQISEKFEQHIEQINEIFSGNEYPTYIDFLEEESVTQLLRGSRDVMHIDRVRFNLEKHPNLMDYVQSNWLDNGHVVCNDNPSAFESLYNKGKFKANNFYAYFVSNCYMSAPRELIKGKLMDLYVHLKDVGRIVEITSHAARGEAIVKYETKYVPLPLMEMIELIQPEAIEESVTNYRTQIITVKLRKWDQGWRLE